MTRLNYNHFFTVVIVCTRTSKLLIHHLPILAWFAKLSLVCIYSTHATKDFKGRNSKFISQVLFFHLRNGNTKLFPYFYCELSNLVFKLSHWSSWSHSEEFLRTTFQWQIFNIYSVHCDPIMVVLQLDLMAFLLEDFMQNIRNMTQQSN